jgi:hypothetical protein
MPTNGSKKTATKSVKRSTPRATPARQPARRDYVRRSGVKFTQEEIDAIRSQWRD